MTIWIYWRKAYGVTIIHVFDKWTDIIDRGGTIDCIYMDFQKAFDKVPHKRLLSINRKLWNKRQFNKMD